MSARTGSVSMKSAITASRVTPTAHRRRAATTPVRSLPAAQWNTAGVAPDVSSAKISRIDVARHLQVHPVDARHVGAPVGIHRALEAGRCCSSGDGQIDVPNRCVEQGVRRVSQSSAERRSMTVRMPMSSIRRRMSRALSSSSPLLRNRTPCRVNRPSTVGRPPRSRKFGVPSRRGTDISAGCCRAVAPRPHRPVAPEDAPTSVCARRPGSSRSIVPSPSRDARARRG